MLIIGYLITLLMGLTLGLIGGGGSILTVPILVYFFSTNPLMATSESLFIVGATALVGGSISIFKKDVQISMVLKFASFSFLGVFLMRKIILPLMPDILFSIASFSLTKSLFIMILFALLMLVVSLKMIRSGPHSINTNQQKSQIVQLAFYGFFVGTITGLIGAGGGFLIVPALVSFLNLKMRAAVGSSLIIIAANSLFGFSLALTSGFEADWKKLLTLLGIALVGLLLGRQISNYFKEAQLKKGFGYFLLVMGSIILMDQISKL